MGDEIQSDELRYERVLQEMPEEVFRMFTNATAMREWLSDRASADPRPGGYFYAGWDSGYYTSGEYTVVKPYDEVSFTWQGRNEPACSQVRVLLEAQEGKTLLTLIHSALGEGEAWKQVRREIHDGWTAALDRLEQVMHEGSDPRVTERPVLGIVFSNLDPDLAEHIGVPVTYGLRIDETIEGLGAQEAGLKKDDIIVEVNGKPVQDIGVLRSELRDRKAGDTVSLVVYRGAEKLPIDMKLSRLNIPKVPDNLTALAREVEKIYQKEDAELDRVLKGVSEEEASFKQSDHDWSVKEIIAHLIHGERENQYWLSEMAVSRESTADGFGDNLDAHVQATVAVYGTFDALREEFNRSRKETVALIERLPETFTRHKGSYWKVGYFFLWNKYHVSGHIKQIQQAVAAAREKK
ncbi:MAG: PDZ domain-containing protein [Chloroflexi bacterium]|nr:PDZ domain-containing protein [Chloroflexota bacterium]